MSRNKVIAYCIYAYRPRCEVWAFDYERYAVPDILQMLYIYCAVYIGPAVKVGDIGV